MFYLNISKQLKDGRVQMITSQRVSPEDIERLKNMESPMFKQIAATYEQLVEHVSAGRLKHGQEIKNVKLTISLPEEDRGPMPSLLDD